MSRNFLKFLQKINVNFYSHFLFSNLQISNRQLHEDLERLKKSLNDVENEADKNRALQKHSAEQQVCLFLHF